MPLPREYISHNQIRLYIECPLKYYFVYIEEIAPPINDRVVLGAAFHSTLEHYFLEKMNQTHLDFPVLAEIFLSHMKELEREKEIDWKIPKKETEERGLAFLRFFLDEIAPSIRPLLCEKELTCEIPGTSILLKGIIDLVEEDFCITDFKTTTSRWTEKKAQNSLQMFIYKYLFDTAYGPVRSSLKYEILCARTPSSIKRQTFCIMPEDIDIQNMLRVVVHVTEMIERGIFPRNEDHRCHYCELKQNCKKHQRN